MKRYLEWYLNWGTESFSALFKNMRANGDIHPAELKRPALRSEDKRYYDAYRALSASRMWSQIGPSPIPVSEVNAYMDMVGIEDPETKLKYLRIIQGLDAVEIKNIRANTKAK